MYCADVWMSDRMYGCASGCRDEQVDVAMYCVDVWMSDQMYQ